MTSRVPTEPGAFSGTSYELTARHANDPVDGDPTEPEEKP